jgi:hypothetical protein
VPGESFDVTSEPPRSGASNTASGRKFVGVKFECCAAYARIYINREGTAYIGNCPRCAKQVKLRIGPDGTDARFFVVR